MIHRIYSSLSGFKDLDFKSGLNVLLAEKSQGATNKQTRNSAGKTSFVEIVHFLLGADAPPGSLMRSGGLAETTFWMEFDLAGIKTTVERSTKNRSKVRVSGHGFSGSGTQITNTEWTEILGEKIFHLQTKEAAIKAPTFRSLFAYFARREENEAFSTPEKQAGLQQIGDIQTALMYLMGFDWRISSDWQNVRDREGTLRELKKAAGLGTFGSIIGKASDLRSELTLAEARLSKLSDEISSFRVLNEYRTLEVEADSLVNQLNNLANGNVLDEATIRELEQSLAAESVPSSLDVETLYKEVGISLPSMVQKQYDDVRSFHASVVRNRRDYLTGELEAARLRIETRNRSKIPLDQRRSEVLRILQSHGALDQFAKLENEASRLREQVESLRQRFAAAELLEGTKNELRIERSLLEQRLRRDFTEQRQRFSDAILAYEETSGRLVEKTGRLNIEPTSNGPILQFSMPGDRGKGVQKMEIFCFDMMLMRLCAKRDFGPGFLIHDSHLFDGVDGRQFINAMRVGSETAQELKFQYIVTMNEDDAFKEQEVGFDLEDYVLPTVLTDATETGGLFGVRFD